MELHVKCSPWIIKIGFVFLPLSPYSCKQQQRVWGVLNPVYSSSFTKWSPILRMTNRSTGFFFTFFVRPSLFVSNLAPFLSLFLYFLLFFVSFYPSFPPCFLPTLFPSCLPLFYFILCDLPSLPLCFLPVLCPFILPSFLFTLFTSNIVSFPPVFLYFFFVSFLPSLFSFLVIFCLLLSFLFVSCSFLFPSLFCVSAVFQESGEGDSVHSVQFGSATAQNRRQCSPRAGVTAQQRCRAELLLRQ